MDPAAVLRAFDAQVRQSTRPDGTGALIERDGAVVRRVASGAQDGPGGSTVTWSDLDRDTAGPVIRAQLDFFGALGQGFEWKLYSYDQPADLADRLLAEGFAAEDAETLMVAEVSELARVPELPPGVRLEQVTDAAGVSRLITLHEQVFGSQSASLHASLLAQLTGAPELTCMVLALADGEPVSGARIEFVPGTQFAGLWGGGTLPQWRGRGLYRALVAYRAALAAQRGYRFLQVDASPDSRPILERIGFTCLATTTPYIWSPG